MFKKILIANRGEVAVRVIRACKEMGIATVAVFSEADRESLHANLADESYCIGPARVADSYLNVNAILTVAKQCGADAIHPGYGLLSENAAFAAKCREEGIVFIGPDPETIAKMGNKDEARRTAKSANVPIIEGSQVLKDYAQAKHVAEKVGFPLLLKAKDGGGGRGIRLVSALTELESAFYSATAEAEAAFGCGDLYIEKYLCPVKHIEVQLICDKFANCVILGERDCSLQRKNQKLIEEAPAPVISAKLRQQLYAAARRIAKTAKYTSVGTVEFLVANGTQYYFMEMNTRLQVEHSVTEMVCGIDIVKWQIRVAADMKLGFTDKDVLRDGHAIECRICAEHPYKFTPSAGEIKILHVPGGMNVRFDSAIYQGYVVPPFYDSMLGKMIVYSKTREESIRKMRSALSELIIDGVMQNSDLYLDILAEPEFESGEYTTSFMKDKGYV